MKRLLRVKKKQPSVTLPYQPRFRKIYILPTRLGVLFSIIMLVMLAGSVNYNNNLGFLLTFLLTSMAIVSMLHTYRNLAGITVNGIFVKPVFAGETACYDLEIFSKNYRPALQFSLEDVVALEDIKPDCANRVVLPKKLNKRGLYHPRSFVIATTYPLGLFRSWTRVESGVSCTVYPKPVPSPYPCHKDTPVTSETQNEGKEPGVEDFYGLRSYQKGDLMQHISWKSFSRGQGLFTKEFTGGSGAALMFELRRLPATHLERRLSWLCSAILMAHQKGAVFGLSLPSETILPGKGEVHKNQCLKALAQFTGPRF